MGVKGEAPSQWILQLIGYLICKVVQWWEQNLFLHFLLPFFEQGVKEVVPSSFLVAMGKVQGTWLSMLGEGGWVGDQGPRQS